MDDYLLSPMSSFNYISYNLLKKKFGYFPEALSKRVLVVITPLTTLIADCFGNLSLGWIKSIAAKEDFEKKIVSLHFRAAKKGGIRFFYSLALLIPRLYNPSFGLKDGSKNVGCNG